MLFVGLTFDMSGNDFWYVRKKFLTPKWGGGVSQNFPLKKNFSVDFEVLLYIGALGVCPPPFALSSFRRPCILYYAREIFRSGTISRL